MWHVATLNGVLMVSWGRRAARVVDKESMCDEPCWLLTQLNGVLVRLNAQAIQWLPGK